VTERAREDGLPRLTSAAAGIVTALLASLLLLFLIAPVGELVARGGAAGARGLLLDAELRGAILRTIGTATAATLLGALLGTPLAWLLARRAFPGRALVAALVDLPLLIPHPVAGIALLLVLGQQREGLTAAGVGDEPGNEATLDADAGVVGRPFDDLPEPFTAQRAHRVYHRVGEIQQLHELVLELRAQGHHHPHPAARNQDPGEPRPLGFAGQRQQLLALVNDDQQVLGPPVGGGLDERVGHEGQAVAVE
jgi:hypothetical protein